jgi:predicted TIM-barrel fold metal-dependent hydrolase
MDWKLISSDSHIIEPPDMWRSLSTRFPEDKVPHIVDQDDGDWWFIDGRRSGSYANGARVGLRFTDPNRDGRSFRFDDVPTATHDPEQFVQENEQDGVYASIIYPSSAITFFGNCVDEELFTAVCQVYNDWLADFCSARPRQLRGVAIVNVDDVRSACLELERARRLGHVGALISVSPVAQDPYWGSDWEPLWACAEDLDMPLGMHVSSQRPASGFAMRSGGLRSVSAHVTTDYLVRVSLANIIFSGVFDRHPKLRVGSVEHELSWAPFFLQKLDWQYRERHWADMVERFRDEMLPSDFFRRNVFLSFQEDSIGLKLRDEIGLGILMWGSDYPHPESTFPRSLSILADQMQGIPLAEQRQITSTNAAALYHVDLS